jgi:CRP/FNR family transcriptional regulator, cyclic AMP receptor protein
MNSGSVGRIVEAHSESDNRVGLVEFEGKRRTVYLNLVPEAAIGDCVGFHAGFATELVTPCKPDSNPGDPAPLPTVESMQAYKLLSELDPQQLRTLLPLAQDWQFEAGQIIFYSGEKSHFLHLIVSGDVTLEEGTGTKFIPVYDLHAGDAMGWSALTSDAVRHFHARAVTQVSTVAFPGADIRAACERDHAMGYALMKRLLALVTDRLDATRVKLSESP